jgi:antitoxin (DNA-binding transcriptional repressor) of toxin-antitoxin stability system
MVANPVSKSGKKSAKPVQVNLYQAKTQLSSPVERAARGEEIVIAKAAKPMACLIQLAESEGSRESQPLPFGKNLLGIAYIADDFYDDLPPEPFELGESDPLFRPESVK